MRMRLLTLALAAILLPFAIGCGGGGDSYQDRQGTIDPETVDNQPPAGMGEGETGDSGEAVS